MSSDAQQQQQQQQQQLKIRLPHPYLTTFLFTPSSKRIDGNASYQLTKSETQESGEPFPHVLDHKSLFLSQVPSSDGDTLKDSDNSAWARAQRSPVWKLTWDDASVPTVGQVWLFLYAIFIAHHETETFRLRLDGSDAASLVKALLLSMVAIEHPLPIRDDVQFTRRGDEVLVLRSAFWQGCASPLGSQPVWVPKSHAMNVVPHNDFVMTPTRSALLRHPRRYPKPEPGSLMYSRYIPSLDEHFSLVALDYQDPEHLRLFNTWQNDPRVAAGWMETGTLDEHRHYLRTLHEDPHVVTVLGRFNDTPFAYFEIYWAKEDHMGAHYAAGDFDRGRHSLVGDDSFRGSHRVMAWWSSVIHYIFLDDLRTEQVVGEPRLTGEKVLSYEMMFGLHQNKFIDLGHKRSNLVMCSRERFFQLCPFYQNQRRIAGTSFGFPAKL